MKSKLILSQLFLPSVFLLAASSAHAESAVWNVDAAGNWATGGNWNPASAPGANSGTANTDTATFGSIILADRVVPYKTVKTEKGIFPLQLHIFNPAGQDTGGKRPCVVLFHGGGWVSGEPAKCYSQGKRWASRGLVAIAVEYRVREKHGGTPLDSVRDAKSAIRWIRSHAGELGIDPAKIAASGTSAGGQLVAATAVIKKFDEEGEDTSVSCRPDAMLMLSPVFDNSPEGYGHYHKILKEHWRDFSPLHNIAAGAPPAIVFVGDSEKKYITVEAAERFQRQMKALASRCELFVMKGATHTQRSKEHVAMIEAEERKFLASLGYCETEAAGKNLESNPATR